MVYHRTGSIINCEPKKCKAQRGSCENLHKDAGSNEPESSNPRVEFPPELVP